ncbi:MAG: hypothetical protein LBD88_02950 [Candidatus Peribacteria bacterium]|nr:hypothetical protein [Candidatus Peribacteria bacterium]
MQDKTSLEYAFLNRLTLSIIVTNVFAIFIIVVMLSIFIRKTIYPVKEITNKIKNFDTNRKNKEQGEEITYYNKNDEI